MSMIAAPANGAMMTAEQSVELEERMFELAQRRAKVYSSSSLVPEVYRNNIGNVMIAMNMANRMGADVLQVMQNLYIVHNRPAWSSIFLIGTMNSCGRFSAIRYRFTGNKSDDTWGCIAYCTELASGEVLEGTDITIAMAKAEGWYSKNGSKWKTMPEQMLRYRSASFLIRTIAPEIGLGLSTKEEMEDVEGSHPDRRPLGGLVAETIVIEPPDEVPLPEPPAPEPAPSATFEQSARVRTQYLEQLKTTTRAGALKSLLKDANEDELLSETDRLVVTTEIQDRIDVVEQ